MPTVWEKLEGYLDTAVDAAAEGYVASQQPQPAPSGQTQGLPEQTVTTVPNRVSDRTNSDALSATVDWLRPYQPFLPFAAVALVVALFWMRGR